MPAPAVIPAPIAYIKVVAVKKLVVGLRPARPGPNVFSTSGRAGRPRSPIRRPFTLSVVTGRSSATSTLNKSECSKRARVARTIKQGMVEDDPPACAHLCARVSVRTGSTKRTGAMICRDGRGHPYLAARGEILGPAKDERLRKRLPSTFSLIKNESRRIEDDQIPS